MKKFKAKKSNRFPYFYILVLLLLFFVFKFLRVFDMSIYNKIYNSFCSEFFDKEINDIDFLMKYTLNVDYKEKKYAIKIKETTVVKEEKMLPLIYVYNTHQTEEYKSNYLEHYNISSNVLIASNILKEYLSNYNLETIVENNDLISLRNSMNLSYGSSYRVSRIALEEAYKNNNSLKYFIDLHRDSGSYSKTTLYYNGDNYAKILFVVGLDNPNHRYNLNIVNILSDKINLEVEGLSRGVIEKSGKGVNGIYNQDFNSNVMLIEVGGENNNIEEVSNTLKVFAKVLKNYIEENKNV